MGTVELILGIAVLVMCAFLVVAVLMQSGKDKSLSGSITGGADSFFGKTKGRTMDKIMGKLTMIVAIVFVLVVIAMYLFV